MIPWASHTTFATNQNWSGSSFPMPLNIGSFTEFTILNSGGGGSGVDEGVSGGGGVDEWDEGGGSLRIHGNPCLIN